MHGLRFEYEGDGGQLIIHARAEDDQGRTWVAHLPAACAIDDPALAIDENRIAKQLREAMTGEATEAP